MSKQEIKETRRKQALKKQRNKQVLIIVGVVALVFVAALVILPELVKPVVREHPTANSNILGNPNAPVIMEDFSDFSCGHCRDFFLQKEGRIIEEYVNTGKVQYIFRTFVNSSVSRLAAEGAYCAADEDKFWEFHDAIFNNPGDLQKDYLLRIGGAIGLDLTAFETCLDNGTYRNVVNNDINLGQAYGVQGTPTFIINGQFIEGNVDYEIFVEAIEKALAEAEE